MRREESLERLVRRLKAEFLEMPGLKLTEAQARRLWALDAASCSFVLERLVETNFLSRTRDGAFIRLNGAFVGGKLGNG
jgi:hypothetical protein